MATIIPFRAPAADQQDDELIDLMTAVDVAIRDLADITREWGSESARTQADECRRMLIRAFDLARTEQLG